MAAALLALVTANSPLAGYYNLLVEMPVEIRIGPLSIAKPLLLWINDGLMAIFFFLVGLELKREILEGSLSRPADVVLPALGAIGGMAVPAAIYLLVNRGNPVGLQGWAIPAATDIAFALGVLALLGNRVPLALKVFLVTVATFDDVGAIVIIAFFYTSQLSTQALIAAALCLMVLLAMNRLRVVEVAPYILVGTIMWTAILKSGVHATLAGVLLAFFIPLRNPSDPARSPARDLEKDLHNVVFLGVLPAFAFANSGITLVGIGPEYLLHPIPLGVAAGLFVGKQLGVFGLCWLGVKLGLARLPRGMSWLQLYGIALLCGIGFTMSLFIGSLAFEDSQINLLFDERIGIIVGSLLSGVAGYFVLRVATKTMPAGTPAGGDDPVPAQHR